MLQFKNLPAIYFQNIPDNDLSWTAYRYCLDIKDIPEVRKFITESEDACLYCKFVKDRPEIRKFITSSDDAYWYCKHVKDRKSIRKLITDSVDAYLYCKEINVCTDVRKIITNSDNKNSKYYKLENFIANKLTITTMWCILKKYWRRLWI